MMKLLHLAAILTYYLNESSQAVDAVCYFLIIFTVTTLTVFATALVFEQERFTRMFQRSRGESGLAEGISQTVTVFEILLLIASGLYLAAYGAVYASVIYYSVKYSAINQVRLKNGN